MSNFVEDLTSLPYPKTDERPLASGADPTQWIISADWNALCQAALDLRAFILDPSNTQLPDTGVSPGSYAYASIVVDSKGRLTAAGPGVTPAIATTTISAGTGLTGGGSLASNRTLSLADTAVTPGSYTNSSITVDQQGRLTSASTGTTAALVSTSILAGTGLSGGGTLAATRTLNLSDTAVTPGAYTLASLTVDQQGRLTAASSGVPSLGMFGDGSDGALSGSASFGRDMFCTTYTGANGDTVNLNGFRLFCSVGLIGPSSGTFLLRNSGGNGTSTGAPSTGALAGILGGSSSAGVSQSTGNGASANPTGTWPTDFRAGLGGSGGAGNATTGGAGSAIGTAQASNIGSFNQLMTAIQGRGMASNSTAWTGGTAGGNGGGGGASGGIGGTGGSGGGYAVVCARTVTNPSHISIEAKGGNGGAGGSGGGQTGGGGGGGGGYCVHVVASGTPASQSAAGGTGGAGTNGGGSGTSGAAGKVVTYVLLS